jgi:Flp pilus assembly protein TadG
MSADEDAGQASVELALVLPLVVLLLLALIQAGLVVRDRILVTHAAREAVRAAALEDDQEAIERAATQAGPLDQDRLSVEVAGRDGPGSQVEVVVSYQAPTNVPLAGVLVGDVRLQASASMRVER